MTDLEDNEIKHETDHLTVNADGVGKNLNLHGRNHINLQTNGTNRINIQNGLTSHYQKQRPNIDGTLDSGDASHQWKQVFTENSIQTPLTGVVTINTDFTVPENQVIALPYTVPTISYNVFFTFLASDINPSAIKIEHVKSQNTNEQFEIVVKDENGAVIDSSGENFDIAWFIVFHP